MVNNGNGLSRFYKAFFWAAFGFIFVGLGYLTIRAQNTPDREEVRTIIDTSLKHEKLSVVRLETEVKQVATEVKSLDTSFTTYKLQQQKDFHTFQLELFKQLNNISQKIDKNNGDQ